MSPYKVFQLAQKAWKTALNAQDQIAALFSQIVTALLATRTFTNSGAIVAASSIFAPAITDLTALPSPSGLFLVSGVVFCRHSNVDTATVFQLIRDPGTGGATLIGPAITADSSHVNANVSMAIPPVVDNPGIGASHTYAVRVSTAVGTVQVLAANEAAVTVEALPPSTV